MRSEGARLIPLAGQIPVDEVRAVTHDATEARAQFLEERQLAPLSKVEERAPGEFQQDAELRDGIRAVRAAIRLLRWRRRRLERTLAAHAVTARSNTNEPGFKPRAASIAVTVS